MKRLQERDVSPPSKRYRSPPPRRNMHGRDRSQDREQRDLRPNKRDSRDFDSKPNRDSDYDDRSRKRFKDDRGPQGRYPQSSPIDRSEFCSICISGFPSQVPDPEIKKAMYYEFKKFGEFNVKIVYNAQDKRLCYINFRFSDDARAAKIRHGKMFMFDRPMRVDAVYQHQQQRSHFNQRRSSPDFVKDRGGDRRDVDTFSNRSGSPPGRRRNNSSGPDSRNEQRRGEPRFPYHLDHIPPEDDDKATRTLFVGNLDFDVGLSELRQIFGKHGHVEDIDIKMAPNGRGNPFAFVRYHNLDMAHRAKVELSGQYVGKFQCKIGYGKVTPTSCLWIGGLGPWIRMDTLEREFDRFGVIHKIYWPENKNYAYVLYDNNEAATAARQEMRGFPLGGPNKRLRIDFADPSQATDDQPPSPPPAPAPAPPLGPSGDADDFGEAARVARGEIPSNPKRHGNSDRGRTKDWQDRDSGFRNQNNFGNDYNPRRSGGGRDNHDGRGDNRYAPPQPRTPPDGEMFRDKEPRFDNGNQSPGKRRTTQGAEFSVGGERRSRTSQSPEREHFLDGVEHVVDLAKCLPKVWNGAFALKNSSFSAQLHLVSGDRVIVDSLMDDVSTGGVPTLRITQRLRLDQTKLDEVAKRITSVGPRGHCIMLAMAGPSLSSDDPKIQQRLLRNLVTYLKQKDAAGVVSLASSKDGESGVLHAFPPCRFGHDFLSRRAPDLAFDMTKDDHLLVVAVRGGI